MPPMDKLGDRCKLYEAATGTTMVPGMPLLARLDGRAFHTFTRGMERPFDEDLVECMVQTTVHLVRSFHARVGYTQSDEITLIWEPETDVPFGGRVQKLASVLAGAASSFFMGQVMAHFPDRAQMAPHFDCRVWQVPTRDLAVDVLVWREADAVRNSLSALAQSRFSARQLHGRGAAEQHEMLHQVGVNWNDLPDRLKRGTYVAPRTVERPLSDEAPASLSRHGREVPDVVSRTVVGPVEMPPIRRVANVADVVFERAEPVEITDASDQEKM